MEIRKKLIREIAGGSGGAATASRGFRIDFLLSHPGGKPMDEVGHWLEGLGLGQYAATFAENDIEFDLLSELTDADLEKLGVLSLGHRKRLLKAIAALSGETAAPVDTTLAKAAAEIPPPADAGTSGCSGPVAAPEEPVALPAAGVWA